MNADEKANGEYATVSGTVFADKMGGARTSQNK